MYTQRLRARNRRGSVLVLVLIMLLLVGALVSAMTLSMRGQADSAILSRELSTSLLTADTGLARAKTRLEWEFTSNWTSTALRSMSAGGTVNDWMTTPEGATIDLTCEAVESTHMDFRLVSTSPAPSPRAIEMVVRVRFVFPSAPPLVGSGAGAIVAFGPVSITGNFTVDGRDHPANDTTTVLPGTGAPGISSTSTVTIVSGSTQVGGSVGGTDYAPATKKTAADGTHYDSTSTVWNPETDIDGLDNDGDGLVDELTGQPTSADDYFGQTTGGLKAAAQSEGTFFTTLESYNRFVKPENNSNGVDDDGDGIVDDDGTHTSGKIIYLEVANGATVGGGSGWEECLELPKNPAEDADGNSFADPSVVVVAGTNPLIHDTQVGPVHVNNGVFQGVLIADRIVNMNGNGTLLGQVVTFTDSVLGPSIGSGTFDVLFSSEVLGNLPRPSSGAVVPTDVVEDVQMWREVSVP